MSDSSNPPGAPLLVACLCAQWCRTCDAYRDTLLAARASLRLHPDVATRFLWIDIEDEAALVDDIEVETFPTLLIAAGAEPRFLGPVAPHAESLAALVRAHAGDAVDAMPGTSVRALVARLATRHAARRP